jgi:hypothetical protein
LSENQSSITKKAGRRYDILVLLPLGFITVFSFGFVLIHPYYNPNSAQSAKQVSEVEQGSNSSAAPQHEVVNIGTPLQHISPTTQTGSQTSPAPTSQTFSQKIQSELPLLTTGEKVHPVLLPTPIQKLKDDLNTIQNQVKAGLNF